MKYEGLLRIAEIMTAYRAGDAQIPCLLCTPEGDGPFPTVIVLHGSDGFKPNHAKVARDLAREGFKAMAPTWFGGNSPRNHWDEFEALDLTAGVSWLEKRSDVIVNRFGLMGYSRGGGLALAMAALMPQTKAVVNYVGLTRWQGGLEELPRLSLNPNDPYDFVYRLPCPVLSFHGEKDTVVNAEDTLNLDIACRNYHVSHQYVLYPDVDHSFVWPGDKYHRRAHKDSWQSSIAFLKKHLF